MIRAGLLTLASVLVLACSGSSNDGGTGGAANMAGAGNMMPGGNMGGNNPPATAAGNALGTQQAPNDTDQAPTDTDQAPTDTDQAPNDTEQVASETADPTPNPVGGGGSIPGVTGVLNCDTLCHALAGACAGAEAAVADCEDECSNVPGQCLAQFGAVASCYIGLACATGGEPDDATFEAVCASVRQTLDGCGGNIGGGDNGGGNGGSPGVVVGGTGCAGLQSCCNMLDAETAPTCMQAYQGAMAGGDTACNIILGTYQSAQVCP